VGVGWLGAPCSWFVVFGSFWFWASGPLINGASISTPCPRTSVSPCPSKLCFEDRTPWRGFSTLSEALKRLSVRLGAPTACARHWLSQRETSRSEDPPAVDKIRIRIQQTGKRPKVVRAVAG
jgi:hypothetical protein